MSNEEQAVIEQVRAILEGPLGKDATTTLSADAELKVLISEHEFVCRREKGVLRLIEMPAEDPDFTFTVPISACKKLLAIENLDVPKLGIEILKLATHAPSELRIHCHVHASFFRILGRGYLGVLAKGGTSLAKALAKEGLASPAAIRDIINKHRRKDS